MRKILSFRFGFGSYHIPNQICRDDLQQMKSGRWFMKENNNKKRTRVNLHIICCWCWIFSVWPQHIAHSSRFAVVISVLFIAIQMRKYTQIKWYIFVKWIRLWKSSYKMCQAAILIVVFPSVWWDAAGTAFVRNSPQKQSQKRKREERKEIVMR